LESPRCGIAKLIEEGCSKLGIVRLVNLVLAASWWVSLEAMQLILDTFVFVAGAPYGGPIDH